MATKKELEQKKELARMYYMQGEIQKSIAAKTEVSEQTVSKWVIAEHWDAKRASVKITRPELVNKNLQLIAGLLDRVNESDDPIGAAVGVADQISKLAAAIEKLDRKTNVVNKMDTFTEFNKWMQRRMAFDKQVTAELLKDINRYQDSYISECMSKNSPSE
jgi:transposase